MEQIHVLTLQLLLSYQLINLSKPVILTGSQLPIDVEKLMQS